MPSAYAARDIALLIPTKDRPQQLTNLLESLVIQSVSLGRILIVDGGESVERQVTAFADRLPVEYIACHPPGQIRQQKMGLARLDERTPLIGLFDDDIVFAAPDALAVMVAFWNQAPAETAGVACNILNEPPHNPSWLRRLFMVDGREPGKILKSGRNTRVGSVQVDTQTEWLPGGATFWRADILRAFPKKEIYAKRAMCEDLLFSYPIGKRYPLYVCRGSRVRHEHVFDHVAKRPHRYYGQVDVLWRMYFVSLHKELSMGWLVLMYSAMVAGDFISGMGRRDFACFQSGLGKMTGLFLGLWQILSGRSLLDLLQESPAPMTENKRNAG